MLRSPRATVLLGGAALACCLGAAPPANASHRQLTMFEDDIALLARPAQTLQELRYLGVGIVRVSLHWSAIAPAPDSRRRPGFNASDPGAYPGWGPYDAIVRDAQADGIAVLLVPTGFAPLWAQGENPGRFRARYSTSFAFEPSAAAYAEFVRAAGTRYSGHFAPRGESPLPRVSDWELWNEPNFGEDLAPQAVDGSSVLWAPRMYRALLDAGWSGLRASGHGRDTILIGALAARGVSGPPSRSAPEGYPGTYGETKPLPFIRDLYCLNSRNQRYLGRAAALRGCPTTRAGYRRFRSQHPALFAASGLSDHPYPVNQPPDKAASRDPSFTDLSELPRMGSTLDRILRSYGSGRRYPIWNTEYGYITCPPNCNQHRYVSPATAGYYMNWAEYLSWRNSRIATTMQYLLEDPNPAVGTPEYGGFSSGLLLYGGDPKANYYAYRMPIYLPAARTRRGHKLEVWGAVHPATFAAADGFGAQYAQIQFAPGSSTSWRVLKVVRLSDPHGYFDVRVAFPSSGSVRVAWTYPAQDVGLTPPPSAGYTESLGPVTSRVVKVAIT